MKNRDRNHQKATARSNRIMSARNRLIAGSKWEAEDLFSEFYNTPDGFGADAVELMREFYGVNEITKAEKQTFFDRLREAFINPFTLVLFALAVVSLFTDVVFSEPANRSYVAVVIVLVMVTISGVLRFIQEGRSERAAEKLGEMVETTVAVQRKPQGRVEIPLDELVVGDLVWLAAGDMIPADMRMIQVKDLFISQSSLTGESEPIEKTANPIADVMDHPPLERSNLVFMGSTVISGSGLGLVLAVGDETIFGGVAKEVSARRVRTSFDLGVNAVSLVLIRFMCVMVPIVFFVNGFTKGDWLEAFLFALSIAVGLTPEMLPMIVTTNLARGAVEMSRRKVIVKDLSAIQNFGAMNVLCTDKTGTITQDRVILEYHLDIRGNEDARVLRHAFLNSYYQTGLKNLLDIAIIDRSKQEGVADQITDYRKVDEIPFDFQRRRMSVVVEGKSGRTQLITKGAIEEMLSVCSHAEYQEDVVPLTPELEEEILRRCNDYNGDGFRVLGIAHKSSPSEVGAFSVADESGMVLIGFLAFLDPPKESASRAITVLSENGVAVKVLTGDNGAVAQAVCNLVGIDGERMLLGSDIEPMSDAKLRDIVDEYQLFAKLSPAQKTRIVTALREQGNTVGFMGDGINDAAAMKAADVGISVDTAVDIARESADIILLEKDLMVLEQGVLEGRKIYANIIKYIKMTASSNFGNMFSVLVASAFLPFLPMFPIQILMLNLIYDISCTTIPWDNVDAEYLRKPRKWEAGSIARFMLWIGPASSVFDIVTYLVMFFYIGPMVCGGAFAGLTPDQQGTFIMLFHTGWFVESLWSQTLVIHMIRTPKIPFFQSRASWQLCGLTTLGIAVGTLLPYTPLGKMLVMGPLPTVYFPILILIIIGYVALVSLLKRLFIRRYGELL